MVGVRIDEVEPDSAPDEVIRSHHSAYASVSRELEPEQPVVPFERYRDEMREAVSFQKPRHLLAVLADDGAAGYATVPLEYAETNRHLVWFELGVVASARRRHVGTSLLHAVAELALADGRTIVGSGTVASQAGDAFARALGFELRATERKSRLSCDRVDRALMRRWVDDASIAARDYELVAYDGPTPAELVDDFVDLHHVTNTAPRDDLDMDDEVLTPERLREEEDRMSAFGVQRWRVLARHAASGRLAGYTELLFEPHSGDHAEQGWTAVRPEHRGHGIGRWLKAVNILRLLEERPEVEAVDTWNAFSNGPMLAINVAMGFELVRAYNGWQAPTDVVADRAKELLG
ncbi:MAG TPA: GNAT family N-acetyltransferase [Acidimicrobiales bacterium]|nr:GNAT family N-acetyltransferase [Acidimicrobiales bacterium]